MSTVLTYTKDGETKYLVDNKVDGNVDVSVAGQLTIAAHNIPEASLTAYNYYLDLNPCPYFMYTDTNGVV